MPQEKVQQQPLGKIFYTIKAKAFHEKVFNTFVKILLFGIVVGLIHFTAGLDTLLMPLDAFGINVEPMAVLKVLLIIVGVIFAIIVLLSYVFTRGIRSEFYQDRLVIFKNAFLGTSSTEVPYQNIARVTYNKEGLFNQIFRCGTINIELTGMGKDKVEITCVSKVEQIVKYIEEIVKRIKYAQEARYMQGYRR